MRKIYLFTVLVFGIALNSFSQRELDLSVELTNLTPGSEVAPGVYELEFSMTNNGPDDILQGDTLWFAYFIGNDIFGTDGTPGQVNGIIAPANVPNGQEIPWSILTQFFGVISVDVSNETSETDLCAFVALGAGEDPNDLTHVDNNPANNFSCVDINPALASVENMTFEDATSIDVNANSVDITSVLNESISYQIVSITGQVVESGSFNNHVNVSTEAFNNGIYIVNINSSNGSKSVKFAVSK